MTIETRFYVQINALTNTWLDITTDVLLNDVRWSKGIMSSSPLERIASVGTLNISLLNDKITGIENRYTPGHINCIPGFNVRCKIKVITTWRGIEKVQWVGWIPPDGIQQSQAGEYVKITTITAYDWMYFALNYPVTLATLAADKTLGDVTVELAGSLEAQPSRIDQSEYSETFDVVYDTVRDTTTIYTELDKAAKSELGYVYIKYQQGSGAEDILYAEGRTHRDEVARYDSIPLTADQSDLMITETGDNLTTEDGFNIAYDQAEYFGAIADVNYTVVNGANYYNRVVGKSYPRKIGTTTVLFRLQQPIKIKAGETRENWRVSYLVEAGYVKVSADNVSITDYAMNSKADGTGDDMTADLTITPEFGSGDALLSLENTNETTDGYVTVLELSGDPIYIGDTISQVIEIPSDDDSLYGKVELSLEQKYQSDPTVTLEQMTILAVRYAQRINTIEQIEMCADRNDYLAGIYIMTDVGSRILCVDDHYGINEDYFIQGIETEFRDNKTWCTLHLKPARLDSYRFWLLGTVGYSELGSSAVLGIAV